MSLFTTATINRFTKQGETEISVENPFLVDRISLQTTVGNGVYQLPDYVIGIRRVTFLGNKLDPLPQRSYRETFQSATQIGRPFWYIYNNVGQNQIRLFPAPGSIVPTVSNIWNIDIPNGFIIEFTRVADGVNFTIPPYFRRQMLKQYIAKMSFAIEGQGQNIKLSHYYDTKWTAVKADFAAWLNDIHSNPRRLVVGNTIASNFYPGRPVLPINRFGISVDE